MLDIKEYLKQTKTVLLTQDAFDELVKKASAQPEKRTDKRTKTHSCDCISRQAAVDALNVGAELLRRVLDDADIVGAERAKYEWGLGLIESYISDMKEIPSAQPEHTNSWSINSWCIGCKEYDTESKCCPRYNRVIKQTLDDAYRHGETEAEARFHDEIVRCKDCKHRDPEDYKCDCGHDIIWQLPRDDIWYCADAERRSDDTD